MRYSFIGLFLFVTPVQAAEFKVIKNTKDQFIVKMTGRIVTDDIRKVRILLINNRNPSIPVRKKVRNKVLLLDSTGGGFLASHLIGVEVRNYGVTTVIPKGARCYSGCSMIFAAGWDEVRKLPSRIKHPRSRLGVHRPGFRETKKEADKKWLVWLEKYLTKKNAGKEFIRITLATPWNKLRYIRNDELKKMHDYIIRSERIPSQKPLRDLLSSEFAELTYRGSII